MNGTLYYEKGWFDHVYGVHSFSSHSIPSDIFVDAEHHTNNLRDPFPSRMDTPRQILIGSFVVDSPFFANVVGMESGCDTVNEALPLPADIVSDRLHSPLDEEGRLPVREQQLVLQQGRGERQLGEGGSREHDGAERGGASTESARWATSAWGSTRKRCRSG